MKKRLVLLGIFCFLASQSLIKADTVSVNQKDWPQYFPNIECHPSVYEPEFGEVDMSYESPHTKWAKPYSQGKIRVLVIAPRVCHRDTVELAQRLDMEFDAFCSYNTQRLGGEKFEGTRYAPIGYGTMGGYSTPVGYDQEEQLKRLNKLLDKKHDVIILGKMSWSAFPKEIEEKILNQVKNGTGLIISFAGGRAPLALRRVQPIREAQIKLMAGGIPFTVLDSWKRFKTNEEAISEIVSLKKLGKGKVVILNIGGSPSNTFFVPPPPEKPQIKLWQLDYYFSLAAKAVLWAADKFPKENIDFVIRDHIVEIKNTGIEEPFSLYFRVRDDFGDIVYEKESRENTFKLPELAAGEYIVDVILKAKGKCLNWGSTSFEINRDVIIQSVDVAPKIIEPGTKLLLNTTLSHKAQQDFSLRIELVDIFGRLIGDIKEKVLVDQNTVKTEFLLKNPLGNLIRLNAALYDKEQKLSHFETWIPVKLPYPGDDFGFVCWNLVSNEYLWYYARKELYKLGVDSSYGWYWGSNWLQSWTAATASFHIIPYMTRYAISKTTEGPYHARIPCLSDPVYIKEQQQKLRWIAKEANPFAPTAYSLGDENDLSLNDHEVCFSKSCRKSFREYVKGVYITLDALNREWDTSYDSWEQIEPIPLEEAREKSQPARWVDFRMHMENVFLDIHRIGKETVRSIDPDALVGFDGGFDITSFTGYDWWKLSRVLDVWGVYPDHLQSEILRSFHKKEAKTGRWYGGYNHLTRFIEYAHWEPWYDLFHEMNNIWWFNIILDSNGTVQAEDTLNPASFKPFPILKASSEEALEIKSGIGKLLLGCRRDTGGIAILYSQPSLHASTFYAEYGNPNDSQYNFIRVLEDLSYQYRFISYEQLKEGILQKEGYRLLILPCSIALSNKEKEQIYSFIEKGGRVIADIKPGIYDEHGKAVEDLKWEKFVKGKVIGKVLRGYKRDNPEASEMRVVFSKKLKELGIKPEFTVVLNTGEVYEGELATFTPLERNPRGRETYPNFLTGFTEGDVRYIGLLRYHSPKIKEQRAQVKLPQKVHIYNIRTRKYVGYRDRINTDLKAGMAGLWAILPQKVSQLNLKINPETILGKEVSYSIELRSPERHVIRVEVFDPEGLMQKHYCQNLNLNNGKAKGIIPLALNEKEGYWRIKVHDVASGTSDSKTFRVR